MNFRSLEYFAAVADAGSIREAASNLYISEQSLSESIRKLEKELEGPLFVRTRPYTLTRAGETFLDYTRKILSLKEEGLSKVMEINEDEEKPGVIITAGPMGVPVFLPELLAIFHDKYPEYSAKVIQKASGKTDKFTKEELCFLPSPGRDDLKNIPLINDRMVVVVSKELMKKTYGSDYEKLAKKVKKSCDIRELSELSFIDWHEDRTNCFIDALDVLDTMGFSPQMVYFSPNASTNLSFCIKGLGAYITLENMLVQMLKQRDDKEKKELLVFPVKIRKEPFELSVTYLKGKKFNEAEKKFIELTKEFFTSN